MQTTYTLNIFQTKNKINPLLSYNSQPSQNHSYLPLLQLATSQYSNFNYHIINNITGEIVASNII